MSGDAEERRAGENPFSASFVRPGAMAYRFAAGESAASLVERFIAAGRRGQIVGPHGAGKSTLMVTLVEEFESRGFVVEHVGLHDGERRLSAPLKASRGSIICIDGYEQLSYLSRVALAKSVRRNACGLLITTHRAVWFPVRLPLLVEVRPSVETAKSLVMSLLAEHGVASNAGGISPAEVERIFFEVGGDVRELFFRLYDLYQSQRS